MSMSKIGSSVQSLKHQFHQLEVQLKDGAKATPAVLKVIDEMISMVEDEIEPGIEDAHAGDQDLINALHTLITDYNTEQQGKEDLLQSFAREDCTHQQLCTDQNLFELSEQVSNSYGIRP